MLAGTGDPQSVVTVVEFLTRRRADGAAIQARPRGTRSAGAA